MAFKNLHNCFHFHHGNHGFYAERDYGDIEWDQDCNEPTEEEIAAAHYWWQAEGWNNALGEEDVAEAEYLYDSRED